METVCYFAYFDGSLKSLQMLQNVISKFLIQTAEKWKIKYLYMRPMGLVLA